VDRLGQHDVRLFLSPDDQVRAIEVVRTRDFRGEPVQRIPKFTGATLSSIPESHQTRSFVRVFSGNAATRLLAFRFESGTQPERSNLTSSRSNEEYPVGWNPETDPYPAAVGQQVVDQTVAQFTDEINATLADVDASMEDPYSDPAGAQTATPESAVAPADILPVTSVSIQLLLTKFLMTDPCADERSDVNWARGIFVATGAVAVSAILLFPILTSTAVAFAHTVAVESVGLTAAARNLHEKVREFKQCKNLHPEYYPPA
jgi:hypothetical protein